MTMLAQDLRWWPASRLDDLASRVSALADEWCADWGIARCGPVQCVNAHAGPHTDGWRLWNEGAGTEIWCAGLPSEALFVRALFGAHVTAARGTLAVQVAAETMQDWRARFDALLPALPPTAYLPDTPPPTQARPWSGAVRLTVPMPGANLVLHLGPVVSAALMPAPPAAPADWRMPPLTAVEDAVAQRRIPIQIRFEDVELDLGSLQTLAVGDVIRVGHALERPLRAESADGSFRCAAWLGKRGAFRAVSLAKAPVSSSAN